MGEKRNMSDNFDCGVFWTSTPISKKRRITDYFEHKDSPHKIWQVAKKGQIQSLISRFPHLVEEIFGSLDYQTLANCSEVNESWYNTVTNQRLYWTQMISKFTNTCNCVYHKEYHMQWMRAIDKTPFDILKKLAGLARNNCINEHEWDLSDILALGLDEGEVEPELSLFHILASEGDVDLFKYVARKIGYKNMIGTKKERWRTNKKYFPFHEAASRGNFDICKFIIDDGNDKNPANEIGHTPFHTAANYRRNYDSYLHKDSSEIVGHFEICKLIFESTGFLNPPDNNGKTPLHSAASHGNLKICQMIIEKVDNANPSSYEGRDTPLHSASERGYFEICKLIVEKVADKNPGNRYGRTPLHRAADNNNFEICHLIIDRIAEKNPSDDNGNTPLHYAARNNNLEICKLIIEKIVEKNPRNDYGTTPLHHAAENNSLAICKLIAGGIDDNPSDDSGTTPLHHAAENSNLEICKLLCQNSNNKNPKNNRGKTPLDLAFEEKDPRIVYFLIGENNLQH